MKESAHNPGRNYGVGGEATNSSKGDCVGERIYMGMTAESGQGGKKIMDLEVILLASVLGDDT